MFSHSKISFLKTAFLVTIHRYVVNYNKKNTYFMSTLPCEERLLTPESLSLL